MTLSGIGIILNQLKTKIMFFKKQIKIIRDDNFIRRLRCTVIGEGMLHPGNPWLMDYAIKNMPENGIVLEIGVYGGLSTNLILYLLNKNNKRSNILYGCDAWIYEGFKDNMGIKEDHMDGRIDVSRTDYMNHIKKSFIDSTTLLHPDSLPYTCHLRSDDFFEKWTANESFTDVFGRNFSIKSKISFCYIDGDHSFSQAKRDFENVSKKLLVGGFVIIDDSIKGVDVGSAHYINEIRLNRNFKIVMSNPNYLVQKINDL